MTLFYKIERSTEAITRMLKREELSIVDGGLLTEFEHEAARFFGHKYAVAVCNGTAAIHMAYFAAGIQNGDEVLVPTYGFHGMIGPLLQLGAVPVLCDIDPKTLCIDPQEARSRITERTKAIMALHPWGNPADLDSLNEIAKRHGLLVMSDCSHAHGASWKGKPIGASCDLVCASMGKGKLITGGELGVLTTDSMQIRDRVMLFSHTNRVPIAYITKKYLHISNAIGVKYRPHALALRLALDQFADFENRNERLRENAERLESIIKSRGSSVQRTYPKAKRSYWKVIVIDEIERIGRLKWIFQERGLSLEGDHYNPRLHEDSILTDYYGIHQNGFPNSRYLKGRLAQIDAITIYDALKLEQYIQTLKDI